MALPYATLANVKARIGNTNTNRDALLSTLCVQANELVESITYRAIGSNAVAGQLIDGWEAMENGRCLMFKNGIRSVTSLEIAPYTGAAFVTVPITEVFIQPGEQIRQPGWPGFELWMTDIPSASNTQPYFPPGYQNIRISYTNGWDAMPNDLRAAAERTVVRAFAARNAGQADQVGDENVGGNIGTFLAYPDRMTILGYQWRSIDIIGD